MQQPRSTKLLQLLKSDPIYQQLLKTCMAAEPAYLQAVGSLPPNDREAVEAYVSLCEEMDHRALMLAIDHNL